MRTLVIINPAAGSADVASIEDAVMRLPGWSVAETEHATHARELASSAIEEGFERIVAAGGDGTVSGVVQGIVEHPNNRVLLGLIPMGTGNDLARTLAIPDDPLAAIDLVLHGKERLIDLIRVEGGGHLRYCINMAAGGFSGEVDAALEEGTLKETWGPLAYLLGAVKAKREVRAYEATVALDDGSPEPFPALAVLVANGRTCGGGLRVAPLADPEDGLLDVMVIQHGTLLELTGLVARLASGTMFESPHVIHRQGRRVRIESVPPMLFNVDGELLTEEPIVFTVVPRMIRVTVGPEYHRDPIFP